MKMYMNKRTISLVLILSLVISLALSGCGENARSLSGDIEPDKTIEVSDITESSDSYSDFAARLFKECFDGKDNALVSPLSVALALAMVSEGAEGETLEELEDVLGMDIEELRAFASSFVSSADESQQLSIANSLWVNNRFEDFYVNEDFLRTNADYHKAEIFEAAFGDKTVKEINSWVNEKTDGMIENIINSLDERAVMCLVNALLFDAKWADPYNEYQVNDGVFITEDNVTQPAEFLSNMEGIYLEDENATGFLKYYEDCEYAFAALLPNEGVSVEEYVNSLDGDKIGWLLNNTVDCSVQSKLPKFESEFSASLNEILKSMGMEKAFDVEKADFSKLGEIENGNIYIGSVAHKTKISVTEQGTKAGAATAVAMYGAGAPQNPKEVMLDRPFVYMLVDMENKVPIFIGTLMSME